ncbi:MAG: LysR family transcriptional regulator [Succinivibrio sp.]|nr:LysR family transcriptional regulator [Succinivibrio sp.]
MNRYLALQKIVELGNFTRAAEVVGCTQSAISQMIASLEDELRIKLLNRSRNGVTLTKEGQEIFPHIEKLVYEYRAVLERAREIRGLEIGTIRIGTMGSISAHWLPMLMKEFKQHYPAIEFVLLQGDYVSISEWIKSGAVDFGFVNPDAVSGLRTMPVKDGRMLAVLPPNHPLAALEVVPLKELVSEQFILLEEGHYSEPLVAFKSLGLEPDIRYTIHDDYTIMNMVEAGLGVSMMAELMLQRIDYHLSLRPTDPPVIRKMCIGYKDRLSLTTAARRFIDLLKSRMQELP